MRWYYFPEVDSTNTFLLTHDTQDLCDAVCVADVQTAGRGRMGRIWHSPLGQWYVSYQTHCDAQVTGDLSLVAGLVVVQVLEAMGMKGIGLKWPNDLWTADGKLGGILVEIASVSSKMYRVVIGLGLNVTPVPQSQFAGYARAHLQSLTARTHDRDAVCKQVVLGWQAACRVWYEKGFSPFQEAWQAHDIWYGACVTADVSGRRVTGHAQGVNTQGAYLVKDAQGDVHSVVCGTLRLA